MLYIRRKIREQITDNARAYIVLHSHICPLQRRVRKRHLARLKQQQEGGEASEDTETSALLPQGEWSPPKSTPEWKQRIRYKNRALDQSMRHWLDYV